MISMFRQRLDEVNDFILYVNDVRTDRPRLSDDELTEELTDRINCYIRNTQRSGIEVDTIFPMILGVESYLEEETGYQA